MNAEARRTFTPTAEQAQLLDALRAFVRPGGDGQVFILSGAAGTGKTSVIRALVEHLRGEGLPFRIAAPTARAAKVIAGKTGASATTMHSLIYRPEPLPDGAGLRLVMKDNPPSDYTLFVIDEASMISDERPPSDGFFVSGASLLSDFLRFVRLGNARSKVLFVGDRYQLPPVGSAASPALDARYLQERYDRRVRTFELRRVLRQESGSYILDVASALRGQLTGGGRAWPGLACPRLRNVFAAVDHYLHAFEAGRPGDATFIARSNKRVNKLNGFVRGNLGFDAAPLAAGELVVLDQTWTDRRRTVLRGEAGLVQSIDGGLQSFGGLHFLPATVRFSDDAGGSVHVRAFVLLDTLQSERGLLEREQENGLFHEVMKRNTTFRESRHPADDPYVGALRLRYGYALTCNKAQGGEWADVLLDPWYPPGDWRWLYTAVTRASRDLYTWEQYRG